jgi:hypothetical protein
MSLSLAMWPMRRWIEVGWYHGDGKPGQQGEKRLQEAAAAFYGENTTVKDVVSGKVLPAPSAKVFLAAVRSAEEQPEKESWTSTPRFTPIFCGVPPPCRADGSIPRCHFSNSRKECRSRALGGGGAGGQGDRCGFPPVTSYLFKSFARRQPSDRLVPESMVGSRPG